MRNKLTALFGLMLASAFFTSVCPAKTFKVATLSPDGTSWMIAMREGAKAIEKRTNAQVKIKFYPGGVMGNDKAVLRKIRAGQLQGAAVTGGSLIGYHPDNILYSLPAMFQSLEEVDYVRTKMDQKLLSGLEAKGFVAFGIAEGGFAYVMSQKPISSVRQIKQHKVWIPDTDKTAEDSAAAFSISPTSLPIGDVLAGLQTGLVDTVAASPIGAIVLQWHTQVKYVTDLPLFYLYGLFTLQKKAFDKLTPEQQQIVREEMGKQFKKINDQNRQDNIEAMAVLQQEGIKLIKPSKPEVTLWRTRADKYIQGLVKQGKLSSGLLDEMKSLLAEYRQAHQ